MEHVLALGNSILLAHHAVAMVSSMLEDLVVLLEDCHKASPSLLIEWKYGSIINITIQNNLLVGKYFDLGSIRFCAIFSLQYGK